MTTTDDPQVERPPAPYATPDDLRQALVDAGVVHLTAVDGVYHRSWALGAGAARRRGHT